MAPVTERSTASDQFKLFNDHYKIMGEFIGDFLGKHNWCVMDLIEYSKKAYKKELYDIE